MVGGEGTPIYMSRFSNSEEFKHPFSLAFHFLPIPLINIIERTRIFWEKQIKMTILQSFRLETWCDPFGHLIKFHPVKTVVIRQLILSFGSAYSLEMLFSKSINVTGNFFTPFIPKVVQILFHNCKWAFSFLCRQATAGLLIWSVGVITCLFPGWQRRESKFMDGKNSF